MSKMCEQGYTHQDVMDLEIAHDELKLRFKMMESTLLAMFTADAEAGCGFYGNSMWRTNYLDLQKMIGCNLATSVHDPDFGDIK